MTQEGLLRSAEGDTYHSGGLLSSEVIVYDSYGTFKLLFRMLNTVCLPGK